jgi:PAS domain S-box-containing protein
MERKLQAAGLRSMVRGEFGIIIKAKVYTFTGSYSITGQQESQKPDHLQFNLLFSIDHQNYSVHPIDVPVIEKILAGEHNDIRFTVRLIGETGDVFNIAADGQLMMRAVEETQDDHALVRKLESQLRTKSQLLKQAEEVDELGTWEFNLASDKFAWSGGMYRIFDIEPGQPVVPEIYLDHAVPDDAAIAQSLINVFRKEPRPFNCTLRIQAGGKIKTIRVQTDVVHDPNGKHECLVGIDVDISAMKDSESSLAEQESFISKVVNTIPDMISVIDIETRKAEFVNSEPFEAEGFHREMMMNAEADARKDMIHEDDRNRVDKYFRDFRHMQDAEVNVMEYRASSGGPWQWYLAHGRVFRRDAKGRPTHCVNVVRNITAQKKNEIGILEAQHEVLRIREKLALTAENKYKVLFNSIDDGFCIVEMIFNEENKPVDYVFVEVNPAFERQTGLKEAVGKRMKSMRPNHEQSWFDTYGNVARSGKPVRFVNVAQELEGRWYEVYAFPIGEGASNQVAILFHDISMQRMAESNLRDLNEKLRNLDAVKTDFFSNVSHEFRTPLTLMMNPLEEVIANGERLDAEDLAHLKMVHRNVLRLQKLVNMLLDFFRIEAGRMEAKFEKTNISELTADIASNFRSSIEAAGLKFRIKNPFPPLHAYVDRELWEKIVLNLISNAFKFTHKGSIQVAVVGDGDRIQLKVRDTGIGISAENIPKLFERFVRIEGARARTHEGSGIGLALVKELVKMHGGTIDVESQEGKGSQFTVTIPRNRPDVADADRVHNREAYTAMGRNFSQEVEAWLPDERAGIIVDEPSGEADKPSVMIVEDNADMREYLLRTLTGKFVVIPAENGSQALRYLTYIRPDLVLTDVMMPEMDGKALLRELRNRKAYATIPVVLLSARSAEDAKSEAIQLGADDYITKPFSTSELVAIISARIEVARMRAHTEREMNRKTLELEQNVMERTKELIRSRQDVSQANEILKQRNYELMAMNEELSNFAFIASHDLREPLRKITLFTSELARMSNELVSETAKRYAQKILHSVSRMNSLLEDVLSFSSLRARTPLKYTPVNLNQVVDDVRADMAEMIRENSAVIEVEPLPTISGNSVQIYHLFENLLSNAVKFRPQERGNTVRIQSSVLKKENIDLPFAAANTDYVQISVSDNGIGFDQQYVDKIFHMFQRLHPKNEFSGTGMGLAICRKVMQNHRGHISAEGKPGEGAVFHCYFPIEKNSQ